MDFKTAMNELTKHVGLRELAEELGVSPDRLFWALMTKNGSPPEGWQKAAAKVARRRAKELEQLAKELGTVAED